MSARLSLHITGTQAELIAKLHDIADGCLASPRLTTAAENGIAALQAGDYSVRVGVAVYERTDAPRDVTVVRSPLAGGQNHSHGSSEQ